MRLLALLACTALLLAGYAASAARGDDAEALALAKREAQQANVRFQDLDRRAQRATNAAARARAEGEALAARMRAAGLADVRCYPLTFGVATLYVGSKARMTNDE